MGTISSVSGGRVIVNFNHPLSGKEVVYEVKVHQIIKDHKEQIISFLHTSLKIAETQIKVEIKEDKAGVNIGMNLPEPITKALGKKLAELTGLKEVSFGKVSNPT
jgi:hypothetical protein